MDQQPRHMKNGNLNDWEGLPMLLVLANFPKKVLKHPGQHPIQVVNPK